MKMKTLLISCLALLPLSLFAQRVEDGVLKDCYGVSGEYHIEEGVREIGEYAFMMSSVTKVYVPASVERIAKCAFNMAPSLTTVVFAPDSKLKEIGEQAFEMCDKLEAIELPNSVETIGRSAFTFCESLRKVNIPQSLTELAYGTFSTCPSLSKVVIPATCKKIGEFCFANCKGLGIVEASCDSIGTKAFYNCKLLSVVNLKEGVKAIGDSAFARCLALEELSLPESLDTVGAKLFLHCPDFVGFNVPATSKHFLSNQGVLYAKDKSVLYECPQRFKSDLFELPSETKIIRSMAFYECQDVKAIRLHNNIERIGLGSLANNGMTRFDFEGAENYLVENDMIYAKLQSTDGYALIAVPCRSTRTDFVLRPDVAYIGKHTFSFNTTAANITLPERLLGIGEMAFFGCHGLKHFYAYAKEAPVLETEVFGDVPFNAVELHVREGVASLYQLANWPFAYGSDLTGDYPYVANGVTITDQARNGIIVERLQGSENVLFAAHSTIESIEIYGYDGTLLKALKHLQTTNVSLSLPQSKPCVAKIKLADGAVEVRKI